MELDDAPRLPGNGVVLRELRPDDIRVRAAIGRRREVVRAFGGDLAQDEPMTEEEAARGLQHRFGPGPHWVIADDADTFICIIRLAPIDVGNRSGRLGIGIFDPDRLGRGLGSEATRIAVSYGFDELGLHRISLTVLADNARAIASYRKVGFQVEGRMRQTLWSGGTWHDDLEMAILADEWNRLDRS